MSIEARVRRTIAEQLGMDEIEVTRSAAIVDDLGADSLEVVELILAFEEEFGLKIPEEDVEEVTTVYGAIRYITERTSEPPVQEIGTGGDAKTAQELSR